MRGADQTETVCACLVWLGGRGECDGELLALLPTFTWLLIRPLERAATSTIRVMTPSSAQSAQMFCPLLVCSGHNQLEAVTSLQFAAHTDRIAIIATTLWGSFTAPSTPDA